jgi:hypothetical protein
MILKYMTQWLQYLKKCKISGEKDDSHTIPLNGQMPIYIVVLNSQEHSLTLQLHWGLNLNYCPGQRGF